MAGRPKTVFTPEQIARLDEMAFNQCKGNTIAEVIGVDLNTIEAHFSTRLRQKRAEGREALHKTQATMAKTIPVMAIWLGKQHLEQSDKVEGNVTHKIIKVEGLELLP